jgi:hypothetical protein
MVPIRPAKRPGRMEMAERSRGGRADFCPAEEDVR